MWLLFFLKDFRVLAIKKGWFWSSFFSYFFVSLLVLWGLGLLNINNQPIVKAACAPPYDVTYTKSVGSYSECTCSISTPCIGLMAHKDCAEKVECTKTCYESGPSCTTNCTTPSCSTSTVYTDWVCGCSSGCSSDSDCPPNDGCTNYYCSGGACRSTDLCGGGGGGGTPTPTPNTQPYFGVDIVQAPGVVSKTQGDTATYDVNVAPHNSYSGTVNLSVSGCPATATCNFSARSVIFTNDVPNPGTSVLMVSNTSNVVPGTYTITVTGSDGVLSESDASDLTITQSLAAFCDNTWRDVPNSGNFGLLEISAAQDNSGVSVYSPQSYTAWPSYSGGANQKKCTFGLGTGVCLWQSFSIWMPNFSGLHVYAQDPNNIFIRGNYGSCSLTCAGPESTWKHPGWTDIGNVTKPWGAPTSVTDKDGRPWQFQSLGFPFYKTQYKCAPPAPTVTLSGSPNPVAYNASSVLSWSSTNATSCTASGDWSGSKATSGSQSTGPLAAAKTYTLTCTGPGGSTPSTVVINVTNSPPAVTSAAVTEPDYCSSGPAAYINWTYSDPEGDPQSAYQAQVDTVGSSWNPPLLSDSGKISGSGASYFASGLPFDKTLKARVRVWDSHDNVSNWTESLSWKTPKHAYPYVDFTYTPSTDIPAKQPVKFTDQTTFYDSGGNRIWSWLFGDSGTSTQQNPSHTYNLPGLYQVSLTATDKDNYSCSRTKPITIAQPIPVWKEVSPR